MTVSEFKQHCEDIASEEANENWNSREILSRIAGEIGTVSLDFSGDAGMHPDFREDS